MDSEGKRPIAKVQLAIYNSVYILDVSTASGEQELDKFLQAICRAKGIIALDRDLQEGAPPEEQDAFLLRNVRNHLEVVATCMPSSLGTGGCPRTLTRTSR